MNMTTPETSRKRATITRIFHATRQNTTQATARAMKKEIIRFLTGPWRHGHRGTVIAVWTRLLPSPPERVRCQPPLDLIWIRVSVLGTVDGPTSAVPFVNAVS